MTASLEEHVARLTKALKPFAAIADRYSKLSDDYPLWAARLSNQDFAERDLVPVVKIGDLREARAAIAAVREREGTTPESRVTGRCSICQSTKYDADGVCNACGGEMVDDPAPDPADAMRGKCEAIVWAYADDQDKTVKASAVAKAIAALKGNQ